MEMSGIHEFRRAISRAPERTCGLVLGMHRSGTSSIAGVLALLGFTPPTNLIGANRANAKGHWESSTVARLNDRLLDFAGSNWKDWQPLNQAWYKTPYLHSFRNEAIEVVDAEFGSSPMLVLKDPRICRLADFWLQVLKAADIRPALFMPVRDPIEVSQSLEARNGFSPTHGEFLWLRHILDAERATRDQKRFYFSYADFVADWRSVLVRAGEVLDIVYPKLSPAVSLKIDDFIDDDLYHNRVDRGSARSEGLGHWVTTVRDIVDRWIKTGECTDDYAELDRINADFSHAAELIEPLWTSLSSLEEANASLFKRVKEHDHLCEGVNRALSSNGVDVASTVAALTTQFVEHGAILKENAETVCEHQSRLHKEASNLVNALASVQRAAEREKDRHDAIAMAEMQVREADAQLAHSLSHTSDRLVAAYSDVVAIGNLLRNEEVKAAALQAEVDACNARLRSAEAKCGALQLRLDHDAAAIGELSKRATEAEALVVEHVQRSVRDAEAHEREVAQAVEATVAAHGECLDQLAAMTQALEANQAARRETEEHLAAMTHAGQIEHAAHRDTKEQLAAMTQSSARVSSILMKMTRDSIRVPRRSFHPVTSLRWKRFKQRLASEGMFDEASYLAHNQDVAVAGVDPLAHYLEFGPVECRRV